MFKSIKLFPLSIAISLLTNSYLNASIKFDSESSSTPRSFSSSSLVEMKDRKQDCCLSISTLPLEILGQFFKYLNFKEITTVELVDKHFKVGAEECYRNMVSTESHYWELQITETFPKSNKEICREFYQAHLSNDKLKSLNPYKTSPYSVVVTTDFLEPLNYLQCLADQGSNKSMRKIFMRLEGARKSNDLSENVYEKLKKKKAEYRDKILAHYEKVKDVLEEYNDDKQLDYIEYKVAKFIHYTFLDDPGLVRKKRFLEIVRKLKEKQYGKAFLLHYLVGGKANKEYLEKSKAFEDNEFLKISFN